MLLDQFGRAVVGLVPLAVEELLAPVGERSQLQSEDVRFEGPYPVRVRRRPPPGCPVPEGEPGRAAGEIGRIRRHPRPARLRRRTVVDGGGDALAIESPQPLLGPSPVVDLRGRRARDAENGPGQHGTRDIENGPGEVRSPSGLVVVNGGSCDLVVVNRGCGGLVVLGRGTGDRGGGDPNRAVLASRDVDVGPRHHALLGSATGVGAFDRARSADRTLARWSIITERATPSSTAQAAARSSRGASRTSRPCSRTHSRRM